MVVVRHTSKFKIADDGSIGDLVSSQTEIIKRNATKAYWNQLKARGSAFNQTVKQGSGKNSYYTQRAVIGSNHIVRQCFELVDVGAKEKAELNRIKAHRNRQ